MTTTTTAQVFSGTVPLNISGPTVEIADLIEMVNTIAEEGCYSYWADEVTNVKKNLMTLNGLEHNYTYELAVKPYEEDRWLTIDTNVIKLGIERILNGEIQINKHIIEYIAQEVGDSSLGCLDTEAVDCIVQAGLFGGVIYG